MDDRTARIRARAHAIWEQEGRPDGRHDDHWQAASVEFDRDAPTRGAPAPRAEAQAAQAMDADDVAEGGSGPDSPADAAARAALAARAGRA